MELNNNNQTPNPIKDQSIQRQDLAFSGLKLPHSLWDNNILERSLNSFSLKESSLDEVSQAALSYGARFHGVLHELLSSMELNRFKAQFWQTTLRENGDPAIIIEFRHRRSQRFGVSGISLSYGSIEPLSRDAGDGKEKELMMGSQNLDGLRERPFHPSERFDSPVRMILTPGKNADQPFSVQVEYSRGAFEEALFLVGERLSGISEEYSYLFDEIMLPSLRNELVDRSGGQFGEKEIPQIDFQSSVLENGAMAQAHCRVYFPYDKGDQWSEFINISIALTHAKNGSAFPEAFVV